MKNVNFLFCKKQMLAFVTCCVVFAVIFWSCQSRSQEEPDEPLIQQIPLGPNPSIGLNVKWKLVGLFDEKSGHLNIFEPVDCEECYTLTLISDAVVEVQYSIATYGYGAWYYNISEGFPKPCGIENSGLVTAGYAFSFFDLFSSVKSYFVSESELRLYPDRISDYSTPNGNYSCLLFKKYGTFQLEKDNVGGPSMLPQNLKGTRWKLESAYDKISETYQTHEPVEDCHDCYILNFISDSIAKIHTPLQDYGFKFLSDSEKMYNDVNSCYFLDENGNKTNAGHGDLFSLLSYLNCVTSFSVDESEMIFYSAYHKIFKFIKLKN